MKTFLKFLRHLKFLGFTFTLRLLSFVARLGRRSPRHTIFLTGDISYTGGTWTYFQKLFRLLEENGYTVVIILEKRFLQQPLYEKLKPSTKQVISLGNAEPLRNFFKLLLLQWQYRPSALVQSISGFVDNSFLELLHIPILVILHSIVGESFSKRIDAKLRRVNIRTFWLFTVSRYAAEHFQLYHSDYGIPCHYLYTGVPHISFPKKLGSPNIVLTVGHLVSYKRPELWLQIAKTLSSEKLHFQWVGEGELLTTLRTHAKDFPFIQFLGYSDTIESFYAQATIYLHTSMLESYGLAVVEAMSAGLPVVTSAHCALPELVDNGVNGYVCTTDSNEEYIDRLQALLANPEQYTKFSEAAYSKWNTVFSDQRWSFQMTSIVQKVTTCESSATDL